MSASRCPTPMGGGSSEVASAFLVRFTTEDAEIYGRSRRSSLPETKPSKPQNHAADYTRFSPLAFKCALVRSVAVAKKRSIGRAFGLKERSGTAPAGFTTECTEVHGRLGNVAARCLSSRTFRNTPSTPSAADALRAGGIVEQLNSRKVRNRSFPLFHLSTFPLLIRRGRKFAESDAFFGGAGSGWADKFRLLPQISAPSVVKTIGTGILI